MSDDEKYESVEEDGGRSGAVKRLVTWTFIAAAVTAVVVFVRRARRR